MHPLGGLEYAGASVVGIADRDGGAVAKFSDTCVVIPTVDPAHGTAQTEGFRRSCGTSS